MSDKLQKVLANAGIGSRREMERWIEQGRVSVNGAIATLGARVEENDEIRVDGKVLSSRAQQVPCRVLIYNKPEGEICSRKDPEGRKSVFDRLPRIAQGRWISVGRLDINTSGLLLFTNDGELANRLMHPSHEVDREYAVRVFGEVSEQTIRELQRGVVLEDGEASFDTVKRKKSDDSSINQWYSVTLKEGRNREVRRLWESQGVKVSRLIRTRYGNIDLPGRLPNGAWIEMEPEDMNILRKTVQLPPEHNVKKGKEQAKLDHVRLSRMRRAIHKHKQKK
ncbi:MAG: 23S rRNA pseudouridine(2605) synthase RluB [Aestuariibacter sp.]